MKNLLEVMNAIARVMDKPHDTFKAWAELGEVLGEHAQQALLEYDESVQHEQEYIELENENLELRRQIRMMGKVAS